ncbi:MAG: hypothetical protein JWN48_2613 [Myxococcaceae bacterium]|nr:hypothetical protein [Myxococcaceae bacterium]
MRTLSSAPQLCVCALLLACQSVAPPPGRSVRVSVADEEGHALAGVPVEIDGLLATRTAADGTAGISLAAVGPQRARIGVRCSPATRELPPRIVQRASPGGSARLELSFVCRPRERKLAVVVRAPGGKGLMLRADGEPAGRIEADGTLHALVSRAPDSELRLMIDTGDLSLSPRNPTRVVHVGDRDELVIFDQPLVARGARAPARLDLGTRREAPSEPPCAIVGNEEP